MTSDSDCGKKNYLPPQLKKLPTEQTRELLQIGADNGDSDAAELLKALLAELRRDGSGQHGRN